MAASEPLRTWVYNNIKQWIESEEPELKWNHLGDIPINKTTGKPYSVQTTEHWLGVEYYQQTGGKLRILKPSDDQWILIHAPIRTR